VFAALRVTFQQRTIRTQYASAMMSCRFIQVFGLIYSPTSELAHENRYSTCVPTSITTRGAKAEEAGVPPVFVDLRDGHAAVVGGSRYI
jgi:hypothetical protein